jgi:ESCRT-I complex subunit VPS37
MPFKSLKQSQSKINLPGRQEQINNLRVFNDNVVEMVPLRLYEVRFVSESGLKLTLAVHLPDKFPNIKPVVEVNPPVLHPWVDILGTVDAPGLRNFAQHSDLGMVIQAIRREFDKTGVQLAPRAAGAGSKATSSIPGGQGHQQQLQQAAGAPSIQKGEKQSATDQVMDSIRNKLSDLSVEELKSILNDEDHFEKILLEVESDDKTLVNLNESNEKLRDQLKSQAKENQELQSQIETSRNEIICNYENFHHKKSELQETLNKLHQMNARIDPAVLSEKLLELSAHCDEESEEIAESFLQKNIRIENFIPRYINSRGAGYLKKMKADKIKKLKADQ